MNPLNTVRGAITTGFVLAVILTLLIAPTAFHELGLARWFHILSGITWIGLLYYFNLVQIPGPRRGSGRQGRPRRRGRQQVHRTARAAVVPLGRRRHLGDRLLVPRALGQPGRRLHARHGQRSVQLLPADHRHRRVARHDHAVQRVGADLAEPEEDPRSRSATDEEKAAARKTAMLASRTNFVLSIPMLMCMGSATHGLPF